MKYGSSLRASFFSWINSITSSIELTNLLFGLVLNPNSAINSKASWCVLGLIHFVSRDTMNIEGFGDATLEDFYNLGYIKRISDKKKPSLLQFQSLNNPYLIPNFLVLESIPNFLPN